jgi:hypothetical protein
MLEDLKMPKSGKKLFQELMEDLDAILVFVKGNDSI